ncbi:protein kinase [Sorangium sp. So ce134]
MSQLALAEGAIFADRYRVVRSIAMGGMGAVYEVVHLETERRRALKVMLPHMLHSQELRDRFRKEARVAAHVESEHIVDVFDAGVDNATGMPFLVMELLRGEELGDLLRRVGRLSPASAVTYLHQVALALDKSHRAHIVHRDLKPGNIFLVQREDGRPFVKVLDFGIAKLVAEGATSANVTENLGTPLYMAPEQFRADGRVSPATDIYALGMMAYTLLIGSIYWHEESVRQTNVYAFASIAVNGPPEPASVRAARRGVTLPPAFDTWFAQTTAADPAERFRSASAAVRALAEALSVPHPGDAAGSDSGSFPSHPSVPDRGSRHSLPQTPYNASLSNPGVPHAGEAVRSSSAGLSLTKPRPGYGSALLAAIAVTLVVVGVGAGALVGLRQRTQATPASTQAPELSAAPVLVPTLAPSTPAIVPAAGTTAAPADTAPLVTAELAPSSSSPAPSVGTAHSAPRPSVPRLARTAQARPSSSPAVPRATAGPAPLPPVYARD